jgi:hypothetical protein
MKAGQGDGDQPADRSLGRQGARGRQRWRQFAVVLVLDERVGLEHRLEALGGVARPVGELGEMFKVTGDLAFVPRDQDGLDVREVLVQGRPPDAGSSAICDIVTDRSPCALTSDAVMSRIAPGSPSR